MTVFIGPQALQFSRGIKFGNVPAGRPDFVNTASKGLVAHVNTVETVIQKPAGIAYGGRYSGVVKFRFRDYRQFPVPQSIRG